MEKTHKFTMQKQSCKNQKPHKQGISAFEMPKKLPSVGINKRQLNGDNQRKSLICVEKIIII